MAKRTLKKINRKTKLLYMQRRYLSYLLKRMLCISQIQPCFDFACCAWYPNLTMSLKYKLQTAQNACIRFCLKMERRSHSRLNHFEKINWLPIKKRVDQCIMVTAYNFKNNLSNVHMSYIYTLNFSLFAKTRRSVDSFVEPIYVKEISSKSISYLESKIWSGLRGNNKTSTSRNSFKHTLKKAVPKKLDVFTYFAF